MYHANCHPKIIGDVCMEICCLYSKISKKDHFKDKKRQELTKIDAKIAHLKAKWGFSDFEKENSDDL